MKKHDCRGMPLIQRPPINDHSGERQLLESLIASMGHSSDRVEEGVDVLAGSKVENPSAVMEAVAEGLAFHQIKRRGVSSLCWAGGGGPGPRRRPDTANPLLVRGLDGDRP